MNLDDDADIRTLPWPQRLSGGLGLGLTLGVIYCVLGVGLRAVGLGHSLDGSGIGLALLAAMYLFGGLAAGLLGGLLSPLAVGKFGAAVVGFFASIPAALLFAIVTRESADRPADVILLTVILCAALGAPLGVALWEPMPRSNGSEK